MQQLQSLVETFLALLRALVKTWEGLQIELQGQYSPSRLDELHTFTRETGLARATTILLLTPVICTVVAVMLDVMPLRPPAEGIYQQSITYWLRVFFSFAVFGPCSTLQLQHASPRLPFRGLLFIAATTLFAAAAPATFFSQHLLIGFPTPFVFQLASASLYSILFISVWPMWKTIILGDTEVQQDLRQFMLCSSCLFTVVMLCPVIIFAFGKLDGIQQTLFSFAFPVLKLMFKNWATRGLLRLEDITPVNIVMSIDVFYTLLLSCAMQSAASRGTLVSVMGVDVFQSIIALVGVRAVIKRLERLRVEVQMLADATSFASRSLRHNNILSLASSLLESRPHIRDDPPVGLPRHRRQVPWRTFSSMSALVSPTRAARVACADPSTDAKNSPPLTEERSAALNTRAAEVKYVRFTLKLLFMVEFYVLIEFTEVVVAAIYAIYMTAMYYMPNRAYYPSVRALTHDQFVATVGLVVQYAALELLSLAVLCVLLDRLLGFSTLRLLAFTLRKHVVLVQSQLTVWVFMSTQLSLEHFGCDYTFCFAWLRRPVEETIPSGGSPSTIGRSFGP